MFCSKCGTEIEKENTKYCPECGAGIPENSDFESMNYQAPSGFSQEETAEIYPTAQGSGWISLLRVIAWVQFIAIVVIGFVIAVGFGEVSDSLAIPFICAFLVGPVVAFSSIALIMVLLDAAENLMRIRINSDIIVENIKKE